jgi:group I intron endonuclease
VAKDHHRISVRSNFIGGFYMSTKQVISGIYAIVNKVTGEQYIGQSIDIYSRWGTHKSTLRKNRHIINQLQQDWNTLGEDSFEFVILEEVSGAMSMNEAEEKFFLIRYHKIGDHGYNKRPAPGGRRWVNGELIYHGRNRTI